MAEIRISSATRYTSDFTPSTGLSPDQNTVGLWHLDEGTGATARDSSSNALHGSISGATWQTAQPPFAAFCGQTTDKPSCLAILTASPSSNDGTYLIDPDGSGGNAPVDVYCDMRAGGWTLVAAAIGGDRPTQTWGGSGGVDVSDAAFGNRTFRFSDTFITSLRQLSSVMRATKSHGVTAYGQPPSAFDSTTSIAPAQVCTNEALSASCVAAYSDLNTGPWATYSSEDWSGPKTSVISGRNACANRFGVTGHLCDFDWWGDASVWLKLWLK